MKRRTELLLLLLLALLTWAVYANHFYNSFHFDDEHTIVNNLNIRSLKNIPAIFKDAGMMSTLPSNQSYRPLLTASTAIDYYFSGSKLPEPFVFHVTSFTLFLLLGLLCYYLFKYLLNISRPLAINNYIALFAAAWFLLHEANAETVNYIIARSDIMSTFFVVASFVLYLYFPASRKFHLYVMPALLGLLAKEQAIMFVPLLFFYKLFFEQDVALTQCWSQRLKIARVLLSMLAPSLVIILFFLFIRKMTSSSWTPGGTDTMKYIFTQPFVIFHYAYNFILPVNLVVDTDWTVIDSYSDDRIVAGMLFILMLLVVAVIASKKQSTKPVAFGIIWFLLALAPTSLLPFAEVLNDHRTFFPYIGLFLATATWVRNILLEKNILHNNFYKWTAIVAGLALLSLHAMGVYERNKIWATEISLWKEATIKAPANGRAWMNYGVALMEKGDFATAENCFLKTTELWPYYARAYTNLGIVKQYSEDMAAAETYFKKALDLDRGVPASYAFYGKYLRQQRRFAEADSIINKGLELSPNFETLLQLKASRNDTLQNKAPGRPTAESLLNKSLQYYNQGLFTKSIEAAEAALHLKPGYDLAYNNICAAYNRLQQYDKAIEAGKKGLQYNPDNSFLKGNLNEAYRLKAGQ